MSEPNQFEKQTPTRHIAVKLTESLLVLMLLIEIAVPFAHFGLMSLVILVGPGNLEPEKLLAMGLHVLAAVLYFLSFWGVGFCFFGVILDRSPIKWFLITVSVLGVIVLPVAIYEGLDESYLLQLLYCVAGWSVLLCINTLAAFHFMDSRAAPELRC